MTEFALMFNARPGGEIVPVKWGKENFVPDTSIIVMDEGSEALYLWHGVQQGLVARRTALRQAESLKGHGYSIGKSIIGRDIKLIKEIDARKVGKVPEDTQMNDELQDLLDRKFTELDNFIITFQTGVTAPSPAPKAVKAPKVVETPKVETKPLPKPVEPQPVSSPVLSKPTSTATKTTTTASEYDVAEPLPSIKATSKPIPTALVSKIGLTTNAKIAFVFSAILDHFDDIWISKKKDGSYSVEEMDGPICNFSLKEGSKINFSAQSFSRIDPKIKTAIQKKFIELSKLI
jgi:hypothetical protein